MPSLKELLQNIGCSSVSADSVWTANFLYNPIDRTIGFNPFDTTTEIFNKIENQSTMKNLFQYAILEEVEFSNEDSSETSKETKPIKGITEIVAENENEVRNLAIKNDLSNDQIKKLSRGTVKIIIVPFG